MNICSVKLTVLVCAGWTAVFSPSTARGEERRAAERSASRLPGHRNLFNGDCTFLFGDAFAVDRNAKFDKGNLHAFIDLLADSGVDTYLNNPTASLPWYPSKRMPNILANHRRGDREFFRKHFRADAPEERIQRGMDSMVRLLNRYHDLADAGVDWVAEISKACRRRGVSPWLSVRMNDLHGGNSWEGSFFNCALLRDPQYRLSGKSINPRDPVIYQQQALDYSHPEVRDFMSLMIRELAEDYDYEGLELDWLRCPFCLEPPASAEQIRMITEWHAEIRKLTEARSKKTGKPYPLGLRIPCRLGQLKAVGIDVRAMVDAGLIDFVNVSNFWQTSWDVPYDELRRELGPGPPGKGIAIYGVVEAAPNWLDTRDSASKTTSFRLLPLSPELMRGNAAGKLAAGVDGIESFNFFVADVRGGEGTADRRLASYADLRDLANIDRLRGKPKQYCLATRDGAYMFPLYEYAEQVPASIPPEGKQPFRLSMMAEPADAELDLVVQVVTDRDAKPAEIGISFNGVWPTFGGRETDRLLFPCGPMTHHAAQHRAFNFPVSVGEIRNGRNELLVFNGRKKRNNASDSRADDMTVLSIELGLMPRRAASE